MDSTDRGAFPRSSAAQRGGHVRAGVLPLRYRLASLVWMVAVTCAVVLASAALLVAVAGQDAARPITDVAETLAGPLGTTFALHTDGGALDPEKTLLVNWGLAALAYLLAGRLLDRVIRP